MKFWIAIKRNKWLQYFENHLLYMTSCVCLVPFTFYIIQHFFIMKQAFASTTFYVKLKANMEMEERKVMQRTFVTTKEELFKMTKLMFCSLLSPTWIVMMLIIVPTSKYTCLIHFHETRVTTIQVSHKILASIYVHAIFKINWSGPQLLSLIIT